MKNKLLVLLFAMAVGVSLSMPTFAQDSSSQDTTSSQQTAPKSGKHHKKHKKSKKSKKGETQQNQGGESPTP